MSKVKELFKLIGEAMYSERELYKIANSRDFTWRVFIDYETLLNEGNVPGVSEIMIPEFDAPKSEWKRFFQEALGSSFMKVEDFYRTTLKYGGVEVLYLVVTGAKDMYATFVGPIAMAGQVTSEGRWFNATDGAEAVMAIEYENRDGVEYETGIRYTAPEGYFFNEKGRILEFDTKPEGIRLGKEITMTGL